LGLLVYGAGTVFILFHGAGYSHQAPHHRIPVGRPNQF
jgi:hypothetical protein